MVDETEPLLIKVMENGLRIQASHTLQEIRKRIQTGFSNLDDGYQSLDHPDKYPIRLTLQRNMNNIVNVHQLLSPMR